MKDVLFQKICEQLSPFSAWIEAVCLSRNGEPLLDKKIAVKIKKLKEINIQNVLFTTNGALLDQRRSLELIEAGLDEIRISIDGATKETFESIRKGLDFESVVENALNFIRLRNESRSKTKVQIRLVKQERNFHEVTEWLVFWQSRLGPNDRIGAKGIHSWGNSMPSEKNAKSVDNGLPCISPFSSLAILFDGTVPLCGCDYKPVYRFGNINEVSIAEIWRSQKLDAMRSVHLEGRKSEIPMCNGCKIWDLEIRNIWEPVRPSWKERPNLGPSPSSA